MPTLSPEIDARNSEITRPRTVEERNYSSEELCVAEVQYGPGIPGQIDYMLDEQGTNWGLYQKGKEKFAGRKSKELMLNNGETVRILHALGREHSLKTAYIPPEVHVPVPDDCRLDPSRQDPEQRSVPFKVESWFAHRPDITVQQVKGFIAKHLKKGVDFAMSIMVNPGLLGEKHTTCALERHESPTSSNTLEGQEVDDYPGQDSLSTFLPSLCLTRQLNVNGKRHTIIGNGKWHGSSERWHGHSQGLGELPPIFETIENELASRQKVSVKQSVGVNLLNYYNHRDQLRLGKATVELESFPSANFDTGGDYEERYLPYEAAINASMASKDILVMEDFAEGTEVFIPTNLYGSPIVITGKDEFRLFEAYEKVLNNIQDKDSGFAEPCIDFAATYSEETQSYTVVVYPRTNFRPENDIYLVTDKNGVIRPLQIHVGFAAWEMSRVVVAITADDYALLSGELDEMGDFLAADVIESIYDYVSKPLHKTVYQLAA